MAVFPIPPDLVFLHCEDFAASLLTSSRLTQISPGVGGSGKAADWWIEWIYGLPFCCTVPPKMVYRKTKLDIIKIKRIPIKPLEKELLYPPQTYSRQVSTLRRTVMRNRNVVAFKMRTTIDSSPHTLAFSCEDSVEEWDGPNLGLWSCIPSKLHLYVSSSSIGAAPPPGAIMVGKAQPAAKQLSRYNSTGCLSTILCPSCPMVLALGMVSCKDRIQCPCPSHHGQTVCLSVTMLGVLLKTLTRNVQLPLKSKDLKALYWLSWQ